MSDRDGVLSVGTALSDGNLAESVQVCLRVGRGVARRGQLGRCCIWYNRPCPFNVRGPLARLFKCRQLLSDWHLNPAKNILAMPTQLPLFPVTVASGAD
jgi:hypothetical protein